MELITQHTARPGRKVNAGGAGSQAAAILLGLVAILWPETYARIPPGFEASFGASLGGMIGYAIAYWTRERLV